MRKRKPLIWGIAGLLLTAVLLGMAAQAVPTKASAASTSEISNQIAILEAQRASLGGQVAELEKQLSENYNEMEETVKQKLLIDQQVFLLYEQVENIREQLAAFAVLIADKQDELDDAQARLDELNGQYIQRIRTMEESGSLSYWSVLFKSRSFADFLDRMNMIEEIAASDQRRLKALHEATDAVAEAKAALQAEKDLLKQKEAELDGKQAELYAKQTAAAELLASLQAQGDVYKQYLEEAEIQQSVLMNQIAAKNAELADAKYKEWLATSVPPTTTQPPETKPAETKPEASAPGETEPETTAPAATEPEETEPEETQPEQSGDSGWLTPVSGYYISSPFGMRFHPMLGYERMHEGIDMVCPGGTPIYATRSGIVTTASYNDSCGNYVFISHDNGMGSIYMHMSYYVVSSGEEVSQGQLIGYVGSTGLSEVEHLHFGIYSNGAYVNPLDYI